MLDFTKASEWLKLPIRSFVAVSLASGIILFSSENFLKKVGLDTFISSYRAYLGAIFISFSSLAFIYLLSSLLKFIKPWIIQAVNIRQNKKYLLTLTKEEKIILSYYIEHKTRSQSLSITSGVVSSLKLAGIITIAGNLGYFTDFDHIIQPWAWDYLNKHPELLR